MDLSRIEAWTREMLESEAFRRGIRNPEFRTRAELVRLILRDQYGERVAASRVLIAQARGALGNAVNAALAALPEPLDALARLRARLPGGRETHRPYKEHGTRSDRPTTPWTPSSATPSSATPSSATPNNATPSSSEQARATTAVELETPAAPEPAAVREPAPTSTGARRAADIEDSRATWVEADPTTAAAEAYERVLVVERESLTPAAAAPAAPLTVPAGTFSPPAPSDVGFRVPSVPPPPPFSARSQGASSRTFVEEPIRTVSMARLLASQGHRERALAIYEELIAQNSEDASLQDEAAALRSGDNALPPLSAPPFGDDEPTMPDTADRLWCEGEPTAGMRLRWELSEHGRQRARAVLGRDGELAIRVVSIAFDPIRVVRSEITEYGPIDPTGEWTAPALSDSARCFAAVGLRDGERFVAVVHARAS